MLPEAVLRRLDELGLDQLDDDCANIDIMPTLRLHHNSDGYDEVVEIPPEAYSAHTRRLARLGL